MAAPFMPPAPPSFGLTMTAPLPITQPEAVAAALAIEKRPLERYVAPAKPSLVGLLRASLAEALGAAGVPERQRRMRVQQIWHWLYVRGAQDFDAMTTLSKELRVALAERLHPGAPGNRRRANLRRRHAQVAYPPAGRARGPAA